MDRLVKQRLTKLEKIRKQGQDPYRSSFKRDGSIEEVLFSRQGEKNLFQEGRTVQVAGRITGIRSHGKTTFADLVDSSGKIQLLFSEESLGKRYAQWETLDLGDIVGVTGHSFTTRTGEPTLKVSDWELLSKALRPLPEKWHGLRNVELRYRKRYLDLISNPFVKEIFVTRSRMVNFLRRFLDSRGFLEVETPMMQPIPGGALGRPFKTHHQALGIDLYLRIAPELYLKRLLVGGFEKVYELSRNFRNEGISTRHNPEFTMLEVYEAYGDCASMMDLTEELITELFQELKGGLTFEYGGRKVDLTRPWARFSFAGEIEKRFGLKPGASVKEWVDKLTAQGVKLDLLQGKKISRSWLLNFIAELFEPASEGKATFVLDYFVEFSPLAKAQPDHPELADRFELFIGGLEVANAYAELNDPIEQRRRFQAYAELAKEYSQAIDEDFLEALEYGMPPAGGLGIGIDRLAMLLAGCDSIRETIFFPALRPEEGR